MNISNKTLLIGLFALPLAFAGCNDDAPADGGTETDTAGDGDGDTGDGDGDGDGDPGDGDGEPETGDGDGDGDGDPPDPITFGTLPPEDYTRVDRKGMPAVATAVIPADSKDAYNAASPEDDVAGDFQNDITVSVTGLHAALDDDLATFMLVPCLAAECVLVQAAPLVIPDTLKLDLEAPSGFPNGRTLPDPVIDITLAVLLLDLSVPGQTAGTFAGVPINPPANDVEYMDEFPYLAPPN
jgi:hypothetical protein